MVTYLKFWALFFIALGIGWLASLGLITLLQPIMEKCL